MSKWTRGTSRALCVAIAALAMMSGARAESLCHRPANLIANGGLESGPTLPNSHPDSWSFDAFAPGAEARWELDIAHSGRRSVGISAPTPNDARWAQPVAVRQNTLYFLSGWIKTQDVARSSEIVNAGANLSLFGPFAYSPAVVGTRDWRQRGLLFHSGADSSVIATARLGFFAGTTTGAAWFDDIALRELAPLEPHPRWRILVLIYGRTDFSYTDEAGVRRRFVASMTADEKNRARDAARTFVRRDVPALTSANMLPSLTVQFPERPLTSLSRNGGGWWPAPEDTAPERDPAFDSVIVIWDPRATDRATGEPVWIGSAAGLTPAMGLGQTYTTLIVEAAVNYGHRNVFKHEWGHSILAYFEALGASAKPTINNHAEFDSYVNCETGQSYVWIDETNANPIPNSIYHNRSGFTHDYYSGKTATADQPGRCLGVSRQAWALGGPASHSELRPAFSAAKRIPAIGQQVDALFASGMLNESDRGWLQRELDTARAAVADGRDYRAAASLRTFQDHVRWLVANKRLLPDAGTLLIDAASTAASCLSGG